MVFNETIGLCGGIEMKEKLMSKSEFKESKEYKEMIEKIKSYPIGFTFTLKYGEIPEKKGNALKVVTRNCIDMGILESISIGLDIQGNFVEEQYKRISMRGTTDGNNNK